ncbi:MAG: acyl-CoA desaturase [Ktedonobacterales bacterium]|nr:acyl-CoA desaturase [Ktedonobacterales bacterium]
MIPLEVQTAAPSQNQYAELKQRIKQQGLLDKTVPRYMTRIVAIQLLFVGSLATLVLVHVFWVQCLNALLLAFVTAQLGFIGHDAGHRQIFDSIKKNNFVGLLVGNVQVGMSFAWWLDKHNAHHARPNEIDSDPDIAVPIIAFTREDALTKRGIARFITRHQAWLFFPILMFVALDLHISSIKYLLGKDAKHPWREAALLGVYFAWYLGVIFAVLPWWQAIVFILIHQAATGLYLGSVFAPNHKGMLITEHDSQLDFLRRQVLTARNVRSGLIADYWYGGLNFQIEHHLFPTMPRRHLARAQVIIREFCEERGVTYHETSCLTSYREILGSLAEVGAVVRKKALATN